MRGYLVSMDGMTIQDLDLQESGTPNVYYGIPSAGNYYTRYTHTLGVDFFTDELQANRKAIEYATRYYHSIINLIEVIQDSLSTRAQRIQQLERESRKDATGS